MRLEATRIESPRLVNGYGDGGFRVGGERWEGSLLLLPGAIAAWPIRDIGGVTAESIARVLDSAGEIEILLVGAGTVGAPLPDEVAGMMDAAGIAVDCMDTGAACRTFNVILAEGRRVAAALVAVP